MVRKFFLGGIFLLFLFSAQSYAGSGPPKRRSFLKLSNEAHGNHYFLATSAIPLDRRHGWYKNTMVTFNSAAYGITSNLAVSGGVDLLSMILSRGSGVWFTRLQFTGSAGGSFHGGVQLIYSSIPMPVPPELADLVEPRQGCASALGMITIGDRRNQLTLQGGIIHNGDRAARGPLLGAAALIRISGNVSFISEHWMITDPLQNYPIHSAGVRILGDLLAFDIGLLYERDQAALVTPIGMPFASATLNF
jgi:hypothetical protein